MKKGKGDMVTRGLGDMVKRGQGEKETRRKEDNEKRGKCCIFIICITHTYMVSNLVTAYRIS